MKTNIKKCAICGKPYIGYGNSTWGYWQSIGESEKSDVKKSEKYRCCDQCNAMYVVPARINLMSKSSK